MMRLRCLDVRDETADMRTWTFEDEAGGSIRFLAGQAITLMLPMPGGETLRRSFSIASSSARPARIELTIKAHAAGRATRWIHDALRPGMVVETTLPHGRFVLPDGTGPIALMSAGSGATPLMAMLRTIADLERARDVAWVHIARTPADLLFAAELTSLQRRLPGLSVSLCATRPQPGWFGYRGRISRRLLSVIVPDLAAREVFCCGPTGFMDEARRIHAAEGGGAASFHVEHFAPAPAAAPLLPELVPEEGFTVALNGRRFAARASETLLEAAGRGNVVIPCGCGGGMCGTCRIRLREGRVDMRHQGGLLPEEEEAGWILACSSRPRSDLVLEL